MSHCPLPLPSGDHLQMAHGAGGKMMHDLLTGLILPALGATEHAAGDAAILKVGGQRLAFTSDSFVVQPWCFPGGDIGKLAVCGTVNDLAMVGARPLYLSCSLILEEGFASADLQTVLASLKTTADAAGVRIVTGDTKVVERGHGDGIYINTAGIGVFEHVQTCLPGRIRAGDAILLSGDLGRHGIAVLSRRAGLAFQTEIQSDVACLHEAVLALFAAGLEVHALRDLTRGGLASGLNELAEAAGLAAEIANVPVVPEVLVACEMLGFDPLSVANEGRFLLVLPENQVTKALQVLQTQAVSREAVRIGRFVSGSAGRVHCQNAYGISKVLNLPVGELLPRIC